MALPRSSGRRPGANGAPDPVPVALSCKAKIIVELQAQPGFRRNMEIGSQPQSCIGCGGANAIHDCADAIGWEVKVSSQLVDADPERFHEVFQENLPGMDWVE